MLGRRQQPDSADPSSDRPSGSISHLLQGLQDYLAARTELLGIESAEAARFAGQRAGLGVVLILAAFFGYALVLVALVAMLGTLLDKLLPPPFESFGWQIIALLTGTLHLFVAFRILGQLRRPPKSPLFEATRAEFQKDHQWIKDQQDNNESNS